MLGDAKLELDAFKRKVPHPFVLLELVELSLRNGGGVAVELGHRVHLKLRGGDTHGGVEVALSTGTPANLAVRASRVAATLAGLKPDDTPGGEDFGTGSVPRGRASRPGAEQGGVNHLQGDVSGAVRRKLITGGEHWRSGRRATAIETGINAGPLSSHSLGQLSSSGSLLPLQGGHGLSVSRLRSTEIGLKLNGGRVGAGEADTHVLKLLRHAGHRARVLFESGRAGRRSPWGSSERVGAALLAARGGAGVVADAFAAKSLHEGVLVGIRGAPSDEVVVDGLNDGVSRERAIRRPDGHPELRGEEGIERGTRGVPLRRTQGSKAGPKAKGRLVTPLGTMPLHVDNVASVNEEEVQDVEELHDARVATLGKRAKLGVLRLTPSQ